MAGQSDVDEAGDHHGDAEHPPGGREQEGEEDPHHLRDYETCGHSKHLSAGESGQSQR